MSLRYIIVVASILRLRSRHRYPCRRRGCPSLLRGDWPYGLSRRSRLTALIPDRPGRGGSLLAPSARTRYAFENGSNPSPLSSLHPASEDAGPHAITRGAQTSRDGLAPRFHHLARARRASPGPVARAGCLDGRESIAAMRLAGRSRALGVNPPRCQRGPDPRRNRDTHSVIPGYR